MGDPHPMGASEIAVAVGLGRRRAHGRRAGELYVSPLELALRLRGEIPRYDTGDDDHDAYMGRVSEPGILLWYAQREGLTVGVDLLPGPQIPQPGYSHPSLPWLAVRPDALDVRDGRTVEVKAPERILEEDGWGIPGTAELPGYYYCQVTAQVAVAHRTHGWDRGDLVAAARSARSPVLRAVWTLHRDPPREQRILDAAARWYDRHVLQRIDPRPDGSESARAALQRRWRPDDTVVQATPSQVAIVAQIRELESRAVEATAARDALVQQLQAQMGPATVLEHAGARLATWRPRKGARRIDTDRLRADHPALAEQYTTTGQDGRTWRTE